jgi:LmbE family N-acetylglucosaminyl deacetylase
LARESDLVVAISAAEARTVIERCGADPERVAIVPPGVDHDLFRPLAPGEEAALRSPWNGPPGPPEAAPPGSGPSGPTEAAFPGPPGGRPAGLPSEVDLNRHGRGFVVFAARLQPLKAPDLAIAALAHVPEPIRPDLIVAGDDSPDFADYPAQLHALVDELGLDDYVHIVGPQERAGLAWLLRRAVLCLVPSHSETFGLVALEAAASGTPVIAAARGGLREAVVHGESGRLMDSRQPEDWGVAMTKLLSDPRALAGMGVVARVHARRFSWAATASQLELLYRQALAPAGRAGVAAGPGRPAGPTRAAGPDDEHERRTSGARAGAERPAEPTRRVGVETVSGAERTPESAGPDDENERRTGETTNRSGGTADPTGGAADPTGGTAGWAARRRRPQRYLFLHAHPDDETLETGAVVLALIRAGAEPVVVTATRGELGEVTPKVARALGRAGLTARRLSERTRAIAQLGAWDAGFLGAPPNRAAGLAPRVYSDSGMAWVTPTVAGPAPESPAEAFCRAPLDEVTADVVACARHWRADVLVSYDAHGGYGHPDHVRCHHAARQAARELGLPFWEIVAPTAASGAAAATSRPGDAGTGATAAETKTGTAGTGTTTAETKTGTAGTGTTGPTGTGTAGTGAAGTGTAGATEATVYEAGPGLERLIAAHQAYSSQFTLTTDHRGLVHVGGQAAGLVTRAGLRPVRPQGDGAGLPGDGPDHRPPPPG